MKLEELCNEFDKILEYKINNIDFNMLTSSIKISIEDIDKRNTHKCDIIFKNVSSYYFVNDMGESRKNVFEYEEGNYLEITSIDIIEGDIEIKPKAYEKWLEQCEGSANIVIEIWSRILLIEAEKVIIAGKEYSLPCK